MVWRHVRSAVGSVARPARRRSGVCVTPKIGWAGLDETGNRGNAPKYGMDATRRILRVLDLAPPDGYGRWTGPLIADALGDVDVQHVWRVLRLQKIYLAARRSWCESNDPEFAAKAAEVVGLYMAPPENAIVISVDEKPSIQGAGAPPRLFENARRSLADGTITQLYAARHNDAFRSP